MPFIALNNVQRSANGCMYASWLWTWLPGC